jgi:hypothetical protein
MLPERDAVGVAREMRMEEGGVYVVEVGPRLPLALLLLPPLRMPPPPVVGPRSVLTCCGAVADSLCANFTAD